MPTFINIPDEEFNAKFPTEGGAIVPTEKTVTLRRLLEQAEHCITEARSIVVHGESLQYAEDDARQALVLLSEHILPAIRTLK